MSRRGEDEKLRESGPPLGEFERDESRSRSGGVWLRVEVGLLSLGMTIVTRTAHNVRVRRREFEEGESRAQERPWSMVDGNCALA